MAELNLTKENFEQEVFKSDKPVLIDFWAPWCGPCAMLSPVISEFAEEYDGRIKVCKVNVDEEPELAASFGATTIPMLAVMNEGKPVNFSFGACPKEHIVNLFKEVLHGNL